MTGRHSYAEQFDDGDPIAFDGCRNRTGRGLLCGHIPAAHDLPDGGCSLCPHPTCPRYRTNLLRPALVLVALVLAIGVVLVLSGVFA